MVEQSFASSPEALWAAFEALPSNTKGEIIHDTLYTQPRPSPAHQNIKGAIVADVASSYRRVRGEWQVLIEPGIRLTPLEEFSPDIAGWRREHMPTLPAVATLAPDWLCEVMSRTTRGYDLEIKRAYYAELGVGWLWYIDPDAQTLTASRLERGRWVEMAIHVGPKKTHAPPFDAVDLDLGEWWPG